MLSTLSGVRHAPPPPQCFGLGLVGCDHESRVVVTRNLGLQGHIAEIGGFEASSAGSQDRSGHYHTRCVRLNSCAHIAHPDANLHSTASYHLGTRSGPIVIILRPRPRAPEDLRWRQEGEDGHIGGTGQEHAYHTRSHSLQPAHIMPTTAQPPIFVRVLKPN